MNIEDLEEALEEILPNGYRLTTDADGQIVVHTLLREDDDGELVELEGDADEEDEDYDPDFEPLSDEDDD